MAILLHVSEYGWDQCTWSDEGLSTKRLYAGHQFPSKTKTWLPRLKTTEKSMMLAVERLHCMHKRSPVWMRKKADSNRIDQVSERAAAIIALEEELERKLPIDKSILKAAWSGAWAEGSDQVDTEIQSLLLEKMDNLDISMHVLTFKKLIDDHLQKAPVRGAGQLQAESMAGQLDVDRFDLFMKQLKYDELVFSNWKKKCSNAVMARETARKEFMIKRRGTCEKAAAAYIESFVRLVMPLNLIWWCPFI